ncbi:hypothetical protein [Candidatus Borrarchaeum sp.]|uniref:hypothetical protein n=1 Tax=Candidatus Borrarchaeum sp. TaxID=2846742 RepID=UPI00257A3BCD|nr:hypothetical protein [Candidatus Borrarchaeum sp.]
MEREELSYWKRIYIDIIQTENCDSMSLDAEKAFNKIKEYLAELDRLKNLDYIKGCKEIDLLDQKIKNLVRMIDPNKLTEYKFLFNTNIYDLLRNNNERQEQYLNDLKKIENYLLALTDHIDLRSDLEDKPTKLVKLEEKIIKLDSEAKRREGVVKTKETGATIELIESMRKELKYKNEVINQLRNELKNIHDIQNMQKDIRELKKDIKEIKDLLSKNSR